jgi:hypothetical protein
MDGPSIRPTRCSHATCSAVFNPRASRHQSAPLRFQSHVYTSIQVVKNRHYFQSFRHEKAGPFATPSRRVSGVIRRLRRSGLRIPLRRYPVARPCSGPKSNPGGLPGLHLCTLPTANFMPRGSQTPSAPPPARGSGPAAFQRLEGALPSPCARLSAVRRASSAPPR